MILNSDPEAHLANLKKMPVVETEIDKCIECGYCEPKCPSRDLTLTPRQRIVVRREMQRLKDSGANSAAQDALRADFPYMALDTCAVDGLCATACPVNIDTGTLTKRFRGLSHTASANRIATGMARNFKLVEVGGRVALGAGHMVQDVFGIGFIRGITRLLDKTTRAIMDEPFWQWSAEMPRARRGALPVRTPPEADAVYFPACISRIMGALPGEQQQISVMQALLNVADRAGVKLLLPQDIEGNCCGVPFSSKGFEAAHAVAINHTVESFFRWSEGRKATHCDRHQSMHLWSEDRPSSSEPGEPNEVRRSHDPRLRGVRARPLVAQASDSSQGSLGRAAPCLFSNEDGDYTEAGSNLKRMQRFRVRAAGRRVLRLCR